MRKRSKKFSLGDSKKVNEKALERIRVLEKKYKENWGKDVDYTILPKGITQEMLVTILERITETGESILTGYEKLKSQSK